MTQSNAVVPGAHELIEKPSLAMAMVEVPDGDAESTGPSEPMEPSTEDARVARIREAAFERYEARGCLDGHDVDDWLAAEAALAGERSASAPKKAAAAGSARARRHSSSGRDV